MRRYLTAPRLAIVLALLAGVIFALWNIHDLGSTCGYREGCSLPNFPAKAAFALLVSLAALLTAALAFAERRGLARVAAMAILAAVLAGAATGGADLWFFLSRHCYA
jgi:hypothetical protein